MLENELEKKFVLFVRVIHLTVFGDEAADGTVVGSFSLWRKETTWQLFLTPMVGDTFTASSLSLTGLIGAGASCFVFF